MHLHCKTWVLHVNTFYSWILLYISPVTAVYLCFLYCISLIYFSFTKIHMFLYARIYWLAEFGDVSCLQCNYLRVETLTLTWDTLTLTLTPTCEDFVGRFCRTFCLTILRVTLSSSLTKLCVRPESMIVDTLGGICSYITIHKQQSAWPQLHHRHT